MLVWLLGVFCFCILFLCIFLILCEYLNSLSLIAAFFFFGGASSVFLIAISGSLHLHRIHANMPLDHAYLLQSRLIFIHICCYFLLLSILLSYQHVICVTVVRSSVYFLYFYNLSLSLYVISVYSFSKLVLWYVLCSSQSPILVIFYKVNRRMDSSNTQSSLLVWMIFVHKCLNIVYYNDFLFSHDAVLYLSSFL